jgi:hypothetical protein
MSRFDAWFKKCKIEKVCSVRFDDSRFIVVMQNGKSMTFGPYENFVRQYKDVRKVFRKFHDIR